MRSSTGADTDPPNAPPEGGMLDDPVLGRQWVARRLQRALALERWGAPLRRGLSGSPSRSAAAGGRHAVLVGQADASGRRAERLIEIIGAVGSVPYGATGLAAPVARGGGRLLSFTGDRTIGRLAVWLAEHTASEYETLAALAADASGIPPEVTRAIARLRGQALEEVAALLGVLGSRSV